MYSYTFLSLSLMLAFKIISCCQYFSEIGCRLSFKSVDWCVLDNLLSPNYVYSLL